MKKIIIVSALLVAFIACKQHNADYYYNKGVAFFDNKQYLEALKMYNEAITKDSTNPTYYVNRGCAKDNINDSDGAFLDYQKAYVLDSTDLLANLYIAVTLSDQGNNKQAIVFYDRVTRNYPDYYSAYYGNGLARYEINDYEGALEQFAKYLGYDANNHWVYYYTGMCNKNMGRMEYAKEQLGIAKNMGNKKAIAELEELK